MLDCAGWVIKQFGFNQSISAPYQYLDLYQKANIGFPSKSSVSKAMLSIIGRPNKISESHCRTVEHKQQSFPDTLVWAQGPRCATLNYIKYLQRIEHLLGQRQYPEQVLVASNGGIQLGCFLGCLLHSGEHTSSPVAA